MSFSAPPSQVAFDEDPTRASTLMQQAGYQHPPDFDTPPESATSAGFVPPPLLHLAPEWRCMAFVHERTAPSGHRRLTLLDVRVVAAPDPQNGYSRGVLLLGGPPPGPGWRARS